MSEFHEREAKLIRRERYLKDKARARKLQFGSVTPSDKPSRLNRDYSLPPPRSSSYTQQVFISPEVEVRDVPTIVADIGEVFSCKMPTKCQNCRRTKRAMKDASSQLDETIPDPPQMAPLTRFSAALPANVLTPPPSNVVYQCRVFRCKHSLGTSIYPLYKMYYEPDNSPQQLLLVARKRKKSSSSRYLISTVMGELSRNSSSIVGELRSNLVGSRFQLRTNHKVPTKRRPIDIDSLLLFYETNILGSKGPRRMKVFLPESDSQGLDLLDCYRQSSMSGILQLVNKPPQWDRETASHVLQFKDRVTKCSVKNFQLYKPPSKSIILQFGKVGRNEFTLDFEQPFNAVQAFAIVLSSFDYKLACE